MSLKPRKLLLLPDAEEELRRIDDPLYSEISGRLQLPRQFPMLGSPMSPPFQNWRSIPVGVFRIIYRILPRGIEVAYIRHCKRELPGAPE